MLFGFSARLVGLVGAQKLGEGISADLSFSLTIFQFRIFLLNCAILGSSCQLHLSGIEL